MTDWHAYFVALAYGACALIIVLELGGLIRQRRHVLAQVLHELDQADEQHPLGADIQP